MLRATRTLLLERVKATTGTGGGNSFTTAKGIDIGFLVSGLVMGFILIHIKFRNIYKGTDYKQVNTYNPPDPTKWKDLSYSTGGADKTDKVKIES
eukprot:TRINITY_DN4863_c0_g1_i1.p1 TRINITY_DN4863_c0_g1~~TRINITY_DN4863_c0_g1_i1.p1  ORF type:complete len:110 (+),score=20.56 TRINITY_DN4863_c0_g1_i1:48-332(+)